jgi:hypothetical protein
MVLNVKLQGLKYNFEKVQGCFCKILRLQRFSRFMELFSLRKICRICPQHCGPDPLSPAHGPTDFIKRRSLVSGSMAWIESSEPVSLLRCLYPIGRWVVIGSSQPMQESPGADPTAEAVRRRSSSFLELRWSIFYEVCSYGITATRGTCLC